MTTKYRKFRDVVIERFQQDPEEAHAYLQLALEDYEQDGDAQHLLLALRTVAEAQGGLPKLARKINVEKMTLYKALSETGNPRLSTIYKVLKGLGYKLMLEPLEKHQPS
ncbi:MAG: addiction module antidote protein [Deinococcota bacterium]